MGNVVINKSDIGTEIINAIKSFTERNGYAPSIRELCSIVGIKSTATLHQHLEKLKYKDLIEWTPSAPRTIRVIDKIK